MNNILFSSWGLYAPLLKKGEEMFINKIGYDHIEGGRNCQDFGVIGNKFSYICDGCSEGEHSEVGAKLFCHLIQRYHDINDTFKQLTDLFYKEPKALRNYLCFTVLKLNKMASDFCITYCGDGYIILQDYDGNITFEELSDGEYPKYYVYNYIDEKYLKHYKDGVYFLRNEYSKDDYAKVGIASDGLRFILRANDDLKHEFIECLKSGKELKTKLFINRNYKIFKDDITIIF